MRGVDGEGSEGWVTASLFMPFIASSALTRATMPGVLEGGAEGRAEGRMAEAGALLTADGAAFVAKGTPLLAAGGTPLVAAVPGAGAAPR